MGAYLSKPITEKVRDVRSERHCHALVASMHNPAWVEVVSNASTCLQESEEGESDQFKYGVAAMQGWRTEMVGSGINGKGAVIKRAVIIAASLQRRHQKRTITKSNHLF